MRDYEGMYTSNPDRVIRIRRSRSSSAQNKVSPSNRVYVAWKLTGGTPIGGIPVPLGITGGACPINLNIRQYLGFQPRRSEHTRWSASDG